MNGPRYLLLALGIVLVTGPPAQAFWSQFESRFYIHQQITKIALDPLSSFTYGGATYSFQSNAITAIVNANADQDDCFSETLGKIGLACKVSYEAREHFDSEKLADGFALLISNRDNLRKELSRRPVNQQAVWGYVGKMLHQIQDFYSHSNWITNNPNAKFVDFGLLTQLPPATGVTSPPDWTATSVFTQMCQPDLKTLVAGVTITTGYYPPNDPPHGKCSHGELTTTLKANAAHQCNVKQPIVSPDGIARQGQRELDLESVPVAAAFVAQQFHAQGQIQFHVYPDHPWSP